MFDDTLIRQSGLEYKAKLPCGHIVHYISKDTAQIYAAERGAEIISPMQGPHGPVDEFGKPLFY